MNNVDGTGLLIRIFHVILYRLALGLDDGLDLTDTFSKK